MGVTSPELVAADLDRDNLAGETARRAAGARIQETKRSEFHALDLVLGVRVAPSPVIAGHGARAGRCRRGGRSRTGGGRAAAARLARLRRVAL